MNTLLSIRRLTGAALAASLALTGVTYATTVSTAASTAAYTLKEALAMYAKSGGDIDNIDMAQVMKHLNVEIANHMAQGKFTDRFEILGGHGPIDPLSQERMIAFTSYQISDDRRDTVGRYVIWQKNGEFRSPWESEERVRALLESARLPLVNKGVWQQGSTKGWDLSGMIGRGNSPPQEDRTAEDRTGERSSPARHSPPPPLAQQPHSGPPQTQVHEKAFPQAQMPYSSAWIVWLLVVLGAITGLWLFVRKSAKS